MKFTTIFFIDTFLKNQIEPNTFIETFALFSSSFKEKDIPFFFFTRIKEFAKTYAALSILYFANIQEQQTFMQNLLPSETIIISDTADFLYQSKVLGYSCLGFSHSQEFLPVNYCFEDFSTLTFSYIEYVYMRCQYLPITVAKTKSLLIREFTMEDMPQLFALYQDEHNLQYVHQREPDYTLLCDKFSSYIEQVYPFYDYGLWAVTLKATGEVIGEFGLQCNQIDKEDEIELGYLLHPSFQGKGYACQAIRAIFRYARDVLSFNRIVAVIHPQNKASICVAKKCGMHFEKEFLFHGKPFHLYVISVQTERFFSAKSSSRQVTGEQVYQQYRQNPDNRVYGKRY